MQLFAAAAERVLTALVGPGAEAVGRDAERIHAKQTLDAIGRVIYVGSKVMLRLGFLNAPASLRAALRSAKQRARQTSDGFMRGASSPQCGNAVRAPLSGLFSTGTRGGFANRWIEQVPAARRKYRVCGLIIRFAKYVGFDLAEIAQLIEGRGRTAAHGSLASDGAQEDRGPGSRD